MTDLNRATHFYNIILGFETVLEAEGLALLNGTFIGVPGSATETDPRDHFDPYRVGLARDVSIHGPLEPGAEGKDAVAELLSRRPAEADQAVL